jgi:hypothetical protein
MRGRFGFAVAAAMGVCLIASRVPAQFPPVTDPNKDEAKCEKGTGSALAKFTGAKSKCLSKCMSTARKTMGPYTGCFPPYSDPVTNTCINDSVKGAEAKARAAIVKACTADCPECYPASVCSTGEPFVGTVEGLIDFFPTLIYCTEGGGGTPTKGEGKCEDTVLKSLVKFTGAKTKCYQKCQDNMLKGKIAPGSCDPPVPSDPATAACIFDPLKGAEAKATAAINKKCEVSVNAKNEKPACYGAATGSTWVLLAEGSIDSQVPTTACGSPSGAFLN